MKGNERKRGRGEERTHKKRHIGDICQAVIFNILATISRSALCRNDKSIIFTTYIKDTSVIKD